VVTAAFAAFGLPRIKVVATAWCFFIKKNNIKFILMNKK